MTRRVCYIVECLCRNPNWWLDIDLLFTTRTISLFWRKFSKISHRVGKSLICRWDVSSLGGFTGFRIRIIRATFRSDRKYPLSTTAMNSWGRYLIAIGGNSLRTLPVIGSYPDAFFEFKLVMTSRTAALVRRLMGGSSWYRASNGWRSVSFSSGSLSMRWGCKTSARYSAKACAFFPLVCVQVPCGALVGGDVF
jgi:hypothetical protein